MRLLYKVNIRWFFLLLSIVLLSGCTGMNIAAANQTIVVNEDLSGTISRSIALLAHDFDQVGAYYGLSNPSDLIAQDMAENLYWTSYESDHWQEDGYEWIQVTAQFTDPDELYDLMNAVFSDTAEGSGGAAGSSDGLNDEEFPPFLVSKSEHLFYTEYRLEGTLLALEATGASIHESTFHAQLPGKIITQDTDGQIFPDGQTVAWKWGRYDYVPYHLVTRVTNTGRIFLFAVLFGVILALIIGVIAIRRRSKADPSYKYNG